MTFTMTSGRRLGLFIRTMDSFLANCLDLDLIKNWVVCDDRSSREDLLTMRRRYSFIEFVQARQPGQPASLNRLFSLAETEWFVHWEDDWLTCRRGHFLRQALDIAHADPRNRNVVLRGWQGVHIQDGPVSYNGHVYCPKGSAIHYRQTDWFWYGYSLNPGLQHKPTVEMLGAYDEAATTRDFDKAAARKYRDLGLRRVNPPERYVEHIGEDNAAWEIKA